MDTITKQTRELCLAQADSFIAAAEKVHPDFPHVTYHLSLLALEEIGKANIITALAIAGGSEEDSWMTGALDSHRRKLQWAVWSPIGRIDPADFEEARRFAESAHSKRLSALYVDANLKVQEPAKLTTIPLEDADRTLALARARLEYERVCEPGEPDELTRWFLEAMENPKLSRTIFSRKFTAKYEELGCDARTWAAWCRTRSGRRKKKIPN